MNMESNHIYFHALNTISVLGPKRINALVNYFGSAKKAWEAKPRALHNVNELNEGLIEKITAERDLISLKTEIEKLKNWGIRILTMEDNDYPALLAAIYQPPPVLYIKGKLSSADQNAVSIVGSRRHTYYGREVTFKIAGDLAGSGITTVSGMARGIDTWAHRGTLEKGGRTIAVLGCGLDICYPAENKKLMQEITLNGAVISEFPPGTRPLAHNFPQRNRIISGLSLGTVVVEAPLKSGALITADFALEQGREVFAVPGSVHSPYSKGCHYLLKEGAKLTENTKDILDELSLNLETSSSSPLKESPQNTVPKLEELEDQEKAIYTLIPYTPVHIDWIINESALPPAQVNTILMQMELKGYVQQLPGNNYIKTSSHE